MHKTILSLAVLVASASLFVYTLGNARALPSGPTVSLGASPWQSSTGMVNDDWRTAVTVPDDRIFIVTTFISHHGIDLFQDGVTKVDGSSNVSKHNGSYSHALASGNGHVKFDPGTTVRLRNVENSASEPYFLEGYFAQP